MKKLFGYFLKGLLVFLPVTVTIFIFMWAFTVIDKLLRNLLGIKVPGLGLVATVVLITVIGAMASNVISRKLFELVDSIFKKLPLIKLLYGSIRDLVEAFAGKKKKFDKPVLVTLSPDSGVKAVGFITREVLENLGIEDHIAVYLPQSYNFAGNVLIFPKEAVRPLNINSSDAMTFIVSGGVSGQGRPEQTNP
jgi:uncharacterized membrane protein